MDGACSGVTSILVQKNTIDLLGSWLEHLPLSEESMERSCGLALRSVKLTMTRQEFIMKQEKAERMESNNKILKKSIGVRVTTTIVK
jgi:hypothetical protein